MITGPRGPSSFVMHADMQKAISAVAVVTVFAMLLVTPAVSAAFAPPSPSIAEYRELLRSFSKDTDHWTDVSFRARKEMMAADPDYPIFHHVAVEGWINDPNGFVYDLSTGVYHRFYQYDKTWSDDCMHGNVKNCSGISADGGNRNARTWGHTVSQNLAGPWSEWPGIDSDSPFDRVAVFSGNCVLRDQGKNGVVCIYSGGAEKPCDTAVCATSTDWGKSLNVSTVIARQLETHRGCTVHWNKTGCMKNAPSRASQTNHDSSIFQTEPNGTYYLLSGGCTYGSNGSNVDDGHGCHGNAQVWESRNLQSWTYVKPLTTGGPGTYWELPYLLPFAADGTALPNDRVGEAESTALLFGLGNAAKVGQFDEESLEFKQKAGSELLDLEGSAYYSFNPHASDSKGPGGTTRRLMFGWVEGPTSAAVNGKRCPYWQSLHSIARTVRVDPSSAQVLQFPVEEMSDLHATKGPFAEYHSVRVQGSGNSVPLPNGVGRTDSVDVRATFADLDKGVTSVGLRLRVLGNFSCDVEYSVADGRVSAGSTKGPAVPLKEMQQKSIELRVFLDRSVVEVYVGGGAVTGRCLLPPDLAASLTVGDGFKRAFGAEVFAVGGSATLDSLVSFDMGSMWKDSGSDSSPSRDGATIQPLPAKQIGMYLLLADDTVANYTSSSVWSPELYQYQESGANVVYLTFINPTNMSVSLGAEARGNPNRKRNETHDILFVRARRCAPPRARWTGPPRLHRPLRQAPQAKHAADDSLCNRRVLVFEPPQPVAVADFPASGRGYGGKSFQVA